MTATATTRPPAIFHSPKELEAALGERIVAARPLAQNAETALLGIQTVSGAHWVYKGQWGRSIECAFYRQAKSPLLPRFMPLLEEADRSALLVEFLDASSLASKPPAREAALHCARELSQRVQAVEGDPPVFERLDTPASWRAFVVRTTNGLRQLQADGTVKAVSESLLDGLQRAIDTLDYAAALAKPTGLIHSDLHADNVFVLSDGDWRVIDWQRPRIAPAALDAAYLLESLENDPLKYFDVSVVILMHLLRLGDTVLHLQNAGRDPGGVGERHLLLRISGIMGLT